MTGKAAGHTPAETTLNPDALEVAPGWGRDKLEGWIPEFASEDEMRTALEKAFDYRGDITITKRDGSKIEGYVFDRCSGPSLAQSYVRLFPSNSKEKITISYADIAALAFTGRDTAAGKSWEAWVKKYQQKKAAGEENIGLQPEALE
jgi:hypothetical protein